MKKKSHVAEWKKGEVTELEGLLKKYPVIGIASIHGYPAGQFQQLRKSLGDDVVITVTKLNLFKLALKKTPELKEIESQLTHPTAFIFTEMNPFKLFKLLKQNSSKAYARPGQIAEADIVVPAGDTGLPPGPVLGDLRNAGIEARIAEGSIKVSKDATVVKKGQPITAEAANALIKLGIKPFEVKLSLLAAFQNGSLFPSKLLDVSEEQTIQNLQKGYTNALNLSFNAGYFTKRNIDLLIVKAFRDAKAVGLEAKILDSGVVEELVARASAQAKALSVNVKEPDGQ